VYQGFNERTGWMHTSSGADNIDEYALRITRGGGGITYRHGNDERPVTETRIDVPFRTDTGMASRTFTVYRTHLGPVVRAADGAWISVKLMEDPVNALTQSWLRTKARNHAEFRETMQLHTNSSNNTLYADADGTIAYYHANFVPRRDPRFDWRRPVDGSNPATDWLGVHTLDESPNVINPGSGWVYNANNWPWSAAGPGHSPRAADYPAYFEDGRSETPRGYHALRVLEGRTDFTIERLLAAAYDSYLPAFERQLPALIRAWDRLPASSPQRAALAEQIATLRAWDLRWGESSIATTLAVFWGEEVGRRVAGAARAAALAADDYVATRAADTTLIGALQWASDKLGDDFGSWQTPWGDVNRFQRLTGDIVQQFNDSAPSVPVPFTSARWGSLASFGARAYPGTKRWYGTSGNSFVAVVEFGDSVRAVAISAGGQSGNPASPHFNDQAERYAAGNLREVYFYPNALAQHTARVYRPGAR
jgi:acyl-homoserine-lactone acylase